MPLDKYITVLMIQTKIYYLSMNKTIILLLNLLIQMTKSKRNIDSKQHLNNTSICYLEILLVSLKLRLNKKENRLMKIVFREKIDWVIRFNNFQKKLNKSNKQKIRTILLGLSKSKIRKCPRIDRISLDKKLRKDQNEYNL